MTEMREAAMALSKGTFEHEQHRHDDDAAAQPADGADDAPDQRSAPNSNNRAGIPIRKPLFLKSLYKYRPRRGTGILP